MKKLLCAVALAFSASMMLGGVATAAAATEVVTPADMQGWTNLDTRPDGHWELVDGPETPPLGSGSLHLFTGTGSAKASLANADAAGTLLADVDAMSYSTYRSSASTGSAVQVPSYQLGVDTNGAASGGFTTLVFEPVYNTDQGPIVDDEWQNWDAYNGGEARWWSTRSITGQCAFDCYRTWDDIVASNPNAVVLYLSINQGSGNPGIDANVDAYTFQDTTYDFEAAPSSKDQCKNGGWQSFSGAYTFRNQGDCVSFVASGGKKAPKGA